MGNIAKKGDVICVDRGFYKHYGVYAGNGKVIHYAKSPSNQLDGVIQKTRLDEFCKGKAYHIDNNRARLSPSVTDKQARSMIGKRDYNLVTNNCEHFARGSQGTYQSKQVDNAFGAIAAVGLGFVAGFLGAKFIDD